MSKRNLNQIKKGKIMKILADKEAIAELQKVCDSALKYAGLSIITSVNKILGHTQEMTTPATPSKDTPAEEV
jgi:hypothetical protein